MYAVIKYYLVEILLLVIFFFAQLSVVLVQVVFFCNAVFRRLFATNLFSNMMLLIQLFFLLTVIPLMQFTSSDLQLTCFFSNVLISVLITELIRYGISDGIPCS